MADQMQLYDTSEKQSSNNTGKVKRKWENGFQRWSNRQFADGGSSFGCCGFGIVEGLNRGIDLMLYVLIDKHDAPMDDVQQLAVELNHAAQCVAEGYVTWADIRQMLKEYGVETALE